MRAVVLMAEQSSGACEAAVWQLLAAAAAVRQLLQFAGQQLQFAESPAVVDQQPVVQRVGPLQKKGCHSQHSIADNSDLAASAKN